MEPCAYQHEPVEQVCYELTYKSIQADFHVRKYTLFLLHKIISRCRSPPLVLRFRHSTKIKEDKRMSENKEYTIIVKEQRVEVSEAV